MKENFFLQLSRYSLLIVMFIFLYLLFLLLFPVKVLEITTPYPVLTPVVQAGTYVVLDSEYCKYKALPAVYSVQFIREDTGEVTTIEERYSSNLDTGCFNVPYKVHVPVTLNPGMYTLKLNLRYAVNILRVQNYTLPSSRFEVTEGKDLTQILNEKLDLVIKGLEENELIEVRIIE